jgi:holo-ACP synthase CitX
MKRLGCRDKNSQPGGEILRRLLAAREERALRQRSFLSSFSAGEAGCVAQISLNIPGWPKTIEGEERALASGEELLLEAARGLKIVPVLRARLSNAAGVALIYAFGAAERSLTVSLKRISVAVEETAKWGRVLDIDVITPEGPISRADVGLAPRKCLICGNDAKVCARTRRHSAEDLREATKSLLGSLD